MGHVKRRGDVIAQITILGLAGDLPIAQGLVVWLRKRRNTNSAPASAH